MLCAGLVFRRGERPADIRSDLKHIEVTGTDLSCRQQDGAGIFAAEIHVCNLQCAGRLKNVFAVLCIAKVRSRYANVAEISQSKIAGAQGH